MTLGVHRTGDMHPGEREGEPGELFERGVCAGDPVEFVKAFGSVRHDETGDEAGMGLPPLREAGGVLRE